MGWDIPTRWAVDQQGFPWMDNAHGHPLHPVTERTLLQEAKVENDQAAVKAIAAALGAEVPLSREELAFNRGVEAAVSVFLVRLEGSEQLTQAAEAARARRKS